MVQVLDDMHQPLVQVGGMIRALALVGEALVVGKGQGEVEYLGQVWGLGLGGDARWVSLVYELQS